MKASLLLLAGVSLAHTIPQRQGDGIQNVFLDEGPQTEKRPLRLADVNFLHTTDTHGWLAGHQNQPSYNANWGDFVSFAQHLRDLTTANGQDLLIVDSGDRHDGNGLSDATVPNGVLSSPLFIKQHYDIVSIGNHELYLWENTKQELDVLVPALKDKYVCSNVEFLRDGKYYPIGQKYRYFTTPIQKKRVLAFSFLFDFNRANDKTRVTPIATAVNESWFKTVLSHFPQREVDLIVVAGHLPVDKRWIETEQLHSVLRAHYPKTPIQYFGGHSHIRDFLVFDDILTGLQSGRFCETVGFLGLNMSSSVMDAKDRFFRSYIDFNLDLFKFHTHKTQKSFDTDEGLTIKNELSNARQTLNLDSVIGNVTKSNYYMDYVPLSHNQSIYKMLTTQVLPRLEPDSNQTKVQDERLIIINTGSIRYDLYKGPYTLDSHYIVSPFQNDWVKITLPKLAAIQLVPLLNRRSYILNEQINPDVNLLPPHQRFLKVPADETIELLNHQEEGFDQEDELVLSGKLSKGYVTNDDFGNDGDDTPHKAVKNFRLPNVVASEQLNPELEDSAVDVIFYSFLIPNVKKAVATLGYTIEEPEIYSRKYLGLLLDDFAATNSL